MKLQDLVMEEKHKKLMESPTIVKDTGNLASDINKALVKSGVKDSQLIKVISNSFAGLIIMYNATGNLNKLVTLLRKLFTSM